MATYREHTDLPVYQAAFAIVLVVHQLARQVYSIDRVISVQLRRSAASVCANIAEGWGKRRYPKSLAFAFNVALGEVAEVQFWLEYACAVSLISAEQATDLVTKYREVRAQLIYMSENAQRWCPPARGQRRRP
jgi:four helix bundle protein